MPLFKIIKTIFDLLPWVLLALVIYALWPILMGLLHVATAVHNFIP